MKIHRKYYLPQKAVVIVTSLATSQASSSSQLRISIKAAQKPLRMLQAMTKVCGRLTKKFKKVFALHSAKLEYIFIYTYECNHIKYQTNRIALDLFIWL